jgi:GAF domain-containing protein
MIDPSLLPTNEAARLQALAAHRLGDTPLGEPFTSLTRQAAEGCGTPLAWLSLVEEQHVRFHAVQGQLPADFPRAHSFSTFAILDPAHTLEVPDARYDERFHDHPLATDQARVVYYAGAPIVDEQGLPLGVLAVADYRPRQLSEDKLRLLQSLAAQASAQLQLRQLRAGD